MVVGVEVEVGCEKCKAFVGMVAEAVLEAYGRLESERAALLRLRRVEELRCVEVEELGVVDGSSFNGVHRLAVEVFGDAVKYAVKARYRDGYREGVGIFLRLREGVEPPVSVGIMDDLVPGVDAQFYGGEFQLRVFGRSGCPVRYLAAEGGGYVELGAGDLGGLASLALLGLCVDRLGPFYGAVVEWVAGLMPFEVGEVELAGYNDVVRRCELILGCTDPSFMRRHILLAGPPGCGKSMIARKVAGAHPEFIRFSLSRGEDWLSLVRLLSKVVEGCGRRVLLVVDEVDELGLSREGGGETVYELLRLLDGVEGSRNVVVLATTSRLEALDEALIRPGRFGPVIPVGLPDLKQRIEIVEYYAAKHGGVVDAEAVARALRCSGAEIRAAVEDCVLEGVSVTTEALMGSLRRVRGGRL